MAGRSAPGWLALKGGAVLFSEMTPPEGGEDAFNAWYDGHHTPNHVQGVPGFISAMRYKSERGPHYLAVYELDSPATLDSAEYRQRKFTPDEATRRMLGEVSGFTRYVGRETFWQARADAPEMPLDAPLIAASFVAVPPDREETFADWFDEEHARLIVTDPDWWLVRHFEVVARDPDPFTHMILRYLGDAAALARLDREGCPFAAEPWFRPRDVVYRRRMDRFRKSAAG